MSTLKVDTILKRTGTGTITLGQSGDTIDIPTGAGLTVTDEVKTNKISPGSGTAFTFGDSGDTFTIPSGATIANSGTATGFGGIENASFFRMTSDFTSDVDPVINWEVDDTAGYGTLGSAVTESSGIFTFPSTGYWLIQASAGIKTGDYRNQDMTFSIVSTINNGGAWSNHTMGFVGPKGNGARLASYNSAILDVTDVSNVKTKLAFGGISSCTVLGDTGRNETYILFIRLADT